MSQTGIVNEIRNVSTLNIIPNPANTVVDISYYFADDNTASNRTIEVYDVVGKPIAEINIGNAAGTYKLDVSRYAQGIYFVEMRENSNHVISKRIIINH
jgi:hypothetical protein